MAISLSLVAPTIALEKTTHPTAKELGIMQGPHEPGVTAATQLNWSNKPYNRWALQNAQALLATAPIYRTDTPVTELPRSDKTIEGLTVTDHYGNIWTLNEAMESTYTDGFLVIHKGEVVYEQYFNDMKPWTKHLAFSVSKSFAGILAEILEDEGKLDLSKNVSDYIPSLKRTAWSRTTVDELINMNTSVDWDESIDSYGVGLKSPFFLWGLATNEIPWRPEYGPIADGLHDFLSKLPKKSTNKGAFHYKSVDTDMAGWVLEAASGESFADLMSTRLWSKIGAEQDASIIVDQYGAPAPNYGLSMTLRDMGRVGMTMAAGGFFNGQQIIPKAGLTLEGNKEHWRKGVMK